MHPKCPEAPVQFQSCGQSGSLRAAPCWFPLAAQGHPLLGGRTLWVGLGGSRLALLSFRGAPDSWGGTRSGIVRKVVVQQVASVPGDALRIKDGRSKAVTSCGLPRPPSIPLPCGLVPPPPHPTLPPGLSTRGQCCPGLRRGLGENPAVALGDSALGWGRGCQLKYRTPS